MEGYGATWIWYLCGLAYDERAIKETIFFKLQSETANWHYFLHHNRVFVINIELAEDTYEESTIEC